MCALTLSNFQNCSYNNIGYLISENQDVKSNESKKMMKSCNKTVPNKPQSPSHDAISKNLKGIHKKITWLTFSF